MGAIYHRYETKEDLLRVLCRQAQNIWVAEVERALASVVVLALLFRSQLFK